MTIVICCLSHIPAFHRERKGVPVLLVSLETRAPQVHQEGLDSRGIGDLLDPMEWTAGMVIQESMEKMDHQ